MTKKLRLQKIFCQGRTVDRHHGLVRPGAAAVQGAGHQFLARARFAGDEHRSLSGGHGGDGFLHGQHGGAAPQNARPGRRFAQLAAQFAVFHAQAGMLDGLPQGVA